MLGLHNTQTLNPRPMSVLFPCRTISQAPGTGARDFIEACSITAGLFKFYRIYFLINMSWSYIDMVDAAYGKVETSQW